MWIKGCNEVILDGRLLYLKELVIHATADLSTHRPVLYCTLSVQPSGSAVLYSALAARQTHSARCNRAAC